MALHKDFPSSPYAILDHARGSAKFLVVKFGIAHPAPIAAQVVGALAGFFTASGLSRYGLAQGRPFAIIQLLVTALSPLAGLLD